MTTLTPSRQRTLEQFRVALAKADAVAMVLRLAVDDLATNPDEHTVRNVVTFATNFAVRQLSDATRSLTGIP